MKGRENKIVVGTVVKAKIRELEEEVRVGSARRMRKELTGAVQAISEKMRFLVRFHDGCENNLYLNQLTVVAAHDIPRSPSQRAKIEGQGEQDCGGDSSQGES